MNDKQILHAPDRPSPLLASKMEIWEIGRLIPSARNARKHSEEQISLIAGSILSFGFVVPVLVDSQGLILAGHGRVQAARKLKLAKIPIVILDHLNEAEKRAFALADNRIALDATWNEDLLRVELEALTAEGVNIETLGFSEDEFRELLDNLEADRVVDEDDVPAGGTTAVCREGDVWCLGDHRVYCGDALLRDSYDVLLHGEPAAMCFGDAPYNVAYIAPGLGVGMRNDDLGSSFPEFLRRACEQIVAHTAGAIYLSMSSSELHTLYEAFTMAGGHWSTFIIWGKNSFTLGRADYQRAFEAISYGWREGHPHFWRGGRDQGDLWLIDRRQRNDLHPTQKPVELIERAVLNSSRRGEMVLDPFGGSGSTLIAAQKTGRKARLIEIDPMYCDVTVRRWQDFTGAEAVLESGGETFAVVSANRLSTDGVGLPHGK